MFEHAMADRSDSWDVFLCHGSCETFDAAIPRSMLAVYPEVVANSTVIAYKEFGSSICPRYHQGKNCNNRTNCLHFHPDFITDHWMVPTSSATSGFRAPASTRTPAGISTG